MNQPGVFSRPTSGELAQQTANRTGRTHYVVLRDDELIVTDKPLNDEEIVNAVEPDDRE